MPADLAEKLRAAIRNSGLSHNELARQTGVNQSIISRFMAGKDMGIHRAAILAKVLGLELRDKS